MMPQRWAIIIDAVTILERRWASSRVTSLILSYDLLFSRHIFTSVFRGCRALGTFVLLEWGPK